MHTDLRLYLNLFFHPHVDALVILPGTLQFNTLISGFCTFSCADNLHSCGEFPRHYANRHRPELTFCYSHVWKILFACIPWEEGRDNKPKKAASSCADKWQKWQLPASCPALCCDKTRAHCQFDITFSPQGRCVVLHEPHHFGSFHRVSFEPLDMKTQTQNRPLESRAAV